MRHGGTYNGDPLTRGLKKGTIELAHVEADIRVEGEVLAYLYICIYIQYMDYVYTTCTARG